MFNFFSSEIFSKLRIFRKDFYRVQTKTFKKIAKTLGKRTAIDLRFFSKSEIHDKDDGKIYK